MINILISSVGRRNYIVDYFKSALNGIGKVVVSNSVSDTAGMYAGDISYVSPPIISNKYIPFIIDLCKKEKISAILPLFDMDLSAVAYNKKLFLQQGVFPIVSDYKIINLCFDKFEYPRLLLKKDINTPKTYLDIGEAILALSEFTIQFPLVLKPRWGTGSVSTAVVKDKEELIHEYTRLSNGLKNSFLESPVPEGYKNQIIIQEFIKGNEFGLDIINDLTGNYVKSFVKKKLGMRSGETDGAITVRNINLETVGAKIAKLLKHIAILDVDIIVSDTSEVYVIDMNPRFGGGYPFTHAAGVDIPSAIVKWLNGDKLADSLFTMINGITSVKGISIYTK